MAARRTEGLVTSGARVTVVAPQVVGAIEALATTAAQDGDAGSLHIEHRPYRVGEVSGYRMVVTATGVPAADRTAPGTVRLPAVLRRGPVTVAVSTGGSSPALARWLRNRIASVVPAEVATMAELVEEARGALRRGSRPSRRPCGGPRPDRRRPLTDAIGPPPLPPGPVTTLVPRSGRS